MKAKIDFDDNKYIKRFLTDNIDGEYEIDEETFEFDYLYCYRLVRNKLVLDEAKKAEQIEREEEESKKPTWQDSIDSQVFYTAMMTDTLIVEE